MAFDAHNVRNIASKTFAEKAAWEFLEKEKPAFTLSTILPPLVFGPVSQSISSLDSLNTSNKFIHGFVAGPAQDEIPPTFVSIGSYDLSLQDPFLLSQ